MAEADVGPEDREGQHELTHDVVMLDGDDIFKVSRIAEGGDDENEDAQAAQRSARKNVNAPHGREPVVVQAHEPVDGCEGETHGEEWKASESNLAIQKCVFGSSGSVLFDGISAEPEAGHCKEQEIKRSTDPEELLGEIGPLFIEKNVLSWKFGHPIPQLWSHEDKRDEEDTHHNKETTNVFHLATNDNTPLGIDGMVHERPEKPSHADGEEKREGKEVGECELLRIREGTEGHCGKGDKGKGDETEKATADMLVVESVVAGL